MLEQELNRNGDGLSIEELEKESEASEMDAIEGELAKVQLGWHRGKFLVPCLQGRFFIFLQEITGNAVI